MTGKKSRTHFDKAHVIVDQREAANRFDLIEEGSVELEAAARSDERTVVAGVIGPQQVLGWSWLFQA